MQQAIFARVIVSPTPASGKYIHNTVSGIRCKNPSVNSYHKNSPAVISPFRLDLHDNRYIILTICKIMIIPARKANDLNANWKYAPIVEVAGKTLNTTSIVRMNKNMSQRKRIQFPRGIRRMVELTPRSSTKFDAALVIELRRGKTVTKQFTIMTSVSTNSLPPDDPTLVSSDFCMMKSMME